VLRLVFEKNNAFFHRWRDVQFKPGHEAKLNAARQPKVHHFVLTPAEN